MNLGYIETLSPELKLKISRNPVLTILKTENNDTIKNYNSLPKSVPIRNIKIPDTFDGTEVWKDVLSPVRDQSTCGSCWAFASTSCLADRFNIQSGGKIRLELSPTYMLLCDFLGKDFMVKHPEVDISQVSQINAESLNKGGCTGNTLFDAWRYLCIIGTCTEKCIPYNQVLGPLGFTRLSHYRGEYEKLPLCEDITGALSDMCANVSENAYSGEEYGTPIRFFRSFRYYAIPNDEKLIRHNIFVWGPVTTGMVVYPDFYTFDPKNDIYKWNGYGEAVGGHAIEIVGWGVSTPEKGGKGVNKNYWIIRNSWGKKWGRDGYFYMSRGNNECKIEENVITGIPDFFYPDDYLLPDLSYGIQDETAEIKQQRHSINTDITMSAGGIDPLVGYTRRVIKTKPWLDLKPPINYKTLPNWNTFIAGTYFDNRENGLSDILLYIILVILILLSVKWFVQ